tara:strand:- start:119 stop:565 length:447 start_codon:yes stop_codon:yes gene_type:complete
MDRLTRDDISNIIESPSLSNEEIIQVIKHELNINIDADLTKAEMVEEVYSAYQLALTEIETKKAQSKVDSKASNKAPKEKKKSMKENIIELIEKGKYSKKELIEVIDDIGGYKMRAKSSRTRVGRVIRELNSEGKIETLADGLIRFKK